MQFRTPRLLALALAVCTSTASASIVHDWKLDESSGGTALDSITGSTANIGGSSAWTAAKINSGFKTTGSTLGYVNTGNTTVTGSFSLSFWVKPEDVSLDWRNMISKHDGANGTKSFWIGQSQADGAMRFGMYFDGTTEITLDTPASVISSNAWSMVTASWNESTRTQSIYVNGVLRASAVRSSSSFLTPRSSDLLFSTNSMVSTAGPGTGSWARFSGTLDDVALWNHAMSTGETKALYNMNGITGLGSYDAQAFDSLRNAYLTNFPQQVGNVRWTRATGLTAGEGTVQHHANGYVMQLDSAGAGVSAVSTISLSYDPQHTNLAVGDGVEPSLTMNGNADELTSDSSIGSADVRPTSAQAGTVLVMLWLHDTQGADDRAGLRSELSGASDGSYSILNSSDPQWTRLAGMHGGFDTLIQFDSATLAGAFNWDFATHSDIVVDRVAVATVPEPACLAILVAALLTFGRRRRII